ncbi:MAG: transposase [Spirochaetia bacterium]|nr:transposase [Spirochaetia bacterium]
MQDNKPVSWDVSAARKPNRLKNYDYANGGCFFATFCTHNRERILGSITDGFVSLNPAGIALQEQIEELPGFYNDVKIERSVIMPNHAHLIVSIEPRTRKLSTVVQVLKSLTTMRLTGNNGILLWQRSFHDHIIRDEDEYARIWEYIENNPLKWEEDIENTGKQDDEYYENIFRGRSRTKPSDPTRPQNS